MTAELQIAPPAALEFPFSPPAWAYELVNDSLLHTQYSSASDISIQSRLGSRYSLISAHIRSARSMPPAQLGESIYSVYMQIADLLSAAPASRPIRFWNHICHIHEAQGPAMDRYMVFNVGRFRAFSQWYGDQTNFDKCVATATGVGCLGDDIFIHVLAADQDGIAIANPRQVQPHRYSSRFGPRPPCFARATLLPTSSREYMLMIGGTASIRGEESMFVGNLQRQLDETFENLRALVTHAGEQVGRSANLTNITDLRIYVSQPSTTHQIESATRAAMPQATQVQLLSADLCRQELMVEIEGRARF